MSSILEVHNLCKEYPGFSLDNVSFSLEKGKITGFIGKNGAGKSTTLCSLLNLVHPDSGEVRFFGRRFADDEYGIKQKTGFVSGAVSYYERKKLGKIADITSMFYDSWDSEEFLRCIKLFELDMSKTPSELSSGMKVKFSIALALSHRAELLILDEPTSGIDPLSRDELTDIFMKLCDEGKTVFFSTHITSDLEKCADNIIYIKNGRIAADSSINSFIGKYRLLKFSDAPHGENLIGVKRSRTGFTALTRDVSVGEPATLEEIMIHLESEDGCLD